MDRGKIAVLVVERNHQVSTCTILLNGGVIDYRYIQLSVVVAVKQCNAAAAHCLQDITSVSAGLRRSCDPNLGGDIPKKNVGVRNGIRFAGWACRGMFGRG